ncbi:predicted protein [Nematostella vectensis]|uniref:Right handed beta helix domain-containing protein n=1 Tax=Nematostella vectensis TaxID=45351 RepID=A7SGU4_NEMVE|nr:predicted protein [Nematostella vectensis]|eukprot:XP_001629133.1 predicted protein [Nematostella vectensis]
MSQTMPMIFQTDNLTYEDRFTVYKNHILGQCTARDVGDQIKKYIAQNVNGGVWQAIWRSSPTSNGTEQPFDVVVEVQNVNVDNLRADISIVEPIICQSPAKVSQLKMETVNQNLSLKKNAVPLTELYPIYDESGDNDDSALAIEHVRFFYGNLWREWDEDDDSDISYVTNHLEARLRLYYDTIDGTLPRDLVKKYKDAYDDYKKKHAELTQLQDRMAISDPEQELDDLDVLKCAQKTEECEVLVHSLQMMENPHLRFLLAAVSPAAKAALQKPRGYHPEGKPPATLIVTSELKAGMTKSLPGENILFFVKYEMVVRHFEDLSKAFEEYYSGDTVIIQPGTYSLDDITPLTDTVLVKGEGDSNKILVTFNDDEDDVVIECHAPDITFENITFEQEGLGSESGMLSVKQGKTTLDGCHLKCGIAGISVMGGCELVMKNCKVYDAKSTGVVAHPDSKLHIENCEFYNCGQDEKNDNEVNSTAAVQLNVDANIEPNATLLNNTIHNNSGYGVCVVRSVTDSNSPQCGVNLDMSANKFRGNENWDVGHIILDRSLNE